MSAERGPRRVLAEYGWYVIAICALLTLHWVFEGRPLRAAAAGVAGAAILVATRVRSGRHAAFAAVAIVLSTSLPIVAAAALDLFLHYRYAESGGYNIWGYRGPVAGAKDEARVRIAVLGGSAAFGYGVPADQSFPAHLERHLDTAQPPGAPGVEVINLAWNGEGAYAFGPTLEDYAHLDPDIVVLYSGYNDFAKNTQVFRRQSAIFRATGYMPMLPVLPIRQWLSTGDLSETEGGERVAFRPDLADRSAAGAADLALQITRSLDRQLERIAVEHARDPEGEGGDCGTWAHYCGSIREAVGLALRQGRQVVVVTEPFVGGGGASAGLHQGQQRVLLDMLAAEYRGEPRLHYINMGRAVDLTNPALCYDGLHLTAAGNEQLASHLARAMERVLGLMKTGSSDAPGLAALLDVPAREGDWTAAVGAVEAAAARGQLTRARAEATGWAAKAAAAGKPEIAGLIHGRLALAEFVAGRPDRAQDSAARAIERARTPATLWIAAVVHGFTGDCGKAGEFAGAFASGATPGTFTTRLWAPTATAATLACRGDVEQALQHLESAIPFEGESSWPGFLRGLLHLRERRGHEAELEFEGVVGHNPATQDDPLVTIGHLQLGRARVLRSAATLYGRDYQGFFAAWAQADPEEPLLRAAAAEYDNLRQSVGLPPRP